MHHCLNTVCFHAQSQSQGTGHRNCAAGRTCWAIWHPRDRGEHLELCQASSGLMCRKNSWTFIKLLMMMMHSVQQMLLRNASASFHLRPLSSSQGTAGCVLELGYDRMSHQMITDWHQFPRPTFLNSLLLCPQGNLSVVQTGLSIVRQCFNMKGFIWNTVFFRERKIR